MGVVEAAAELFELLAAQDTTFTKHLLPGLSRDEMHTLVSPLGITLPEEAVQFYEHFNLPKHYQYGPDQPTFYGIYWMLSLEDAVEVYSERGDKEFFCTENETVAGEYEGSGGWFPFLQEDSYVYLLDTAHASNGVCPIIHVPEAGEPNIVFVSLTAMFATMVDWIKEGALAIEEGHLLGDYDGEPVQVGTIALRHNPGVEYWSRWFLNRSRNA